MSQLRRTDEAAPIGDPCDDALRATVARPFARAPTFLLIEVQYGWVVALALFLFLDRDDSTRVLCADCDLVISHILSYLFKVSAYMETVDVVSSGAMVNRLWNRTFCCRGLRALHFTKDDLLDDPLFLGNVTAWLSARPSAWRAQVNVFTWFVDCDGGSVGIPPDLGGFSNLVSFGYREPRRVPSDPPVFRSPSLRSVFLPSVRRAASVVPLVQLESLTTVHLWFHEIPPDRGLLAGCVLPPQLLALRVGWSRRRMDACHCAVDVGQDEDARCCAEHDTLPLPSLPASLRRLDLDGCALSATDCGSLPPSLLDARLARMSFSKPLPETLLSLSCTYVRLPALPPALRFLFRICLDVAERGSRDADLPASLHTLVLGHECDGAAVSWASLCSLSCLRKLTVVLPPRASDEAFPDGADAKLALASSLRSLTIVHLTAGRVFGRPPRAPCPWRGMPCLPCGLVSMTLDGFSLCAAVSHPGLRSLDVAGCVFQGAPSSTFDCLAGTASGCPLLEQLTVYGGDAGDCQTIPHDLNTLRSHCQVVFPRLTVYAYDEGESFEALAWQDSQGRAQDGGVFVDQRAAFAGHSDESDFPETTPGP